MDHAPKESIAQNVLLSLFPLICCHVRGEVYTEE